MQVKSKNTFQTVYTGKNKFRKAILTRISARRWAYRLGFESDLEITNGGESRTKRMALGHIESYLDL